MAEEARRVSSRRVTSLALVVVGTVVLFVGGIALYAREEVFDPDAFAQHASESLGDDRVDAAVANPIVDEVIKAGPDELINARPLLTAGVRGVLASEAFRDAFQDASARVHRQLFSRDRDALVLNIADAGAFVIDAVKSISPETAKKIPKDLQPGLIKLTKSNFAITTVRTAESVRFLGLFLPFLGLVMLAGSVAVAPDRRRGVVAASAAVAIACAVGVIALVIGRSVLLGHFEGDVTRDAIAAVFDNFLGGLGDWFIGVGIGAIVLAAAASTVGEVEPTAPVRRVWDRVIRTPESTAWRTIRAMALLLAGGDGPAKRPAGPVEACNGYPELCDRQINEVAFPGAHNAMSAADADFFAPNQETGIPKQLDRGVRVLLIDAHYGIKAADGTVVTDLERERGGKVKEAVRDQFGGRR